MAKTFYQWAKDNDRDLSFVTENKIRTGIHTAMPSGYVSHEYPPAYFASHIATAYLDLKNREKVKDKAPSDNAP